MEGKIYGLIGEKLGHSFSPQIHMALGNPAYQLYELPREEVETFLRREDLGGVNVTIPYKILAAELCDELSPAAREIGAVNTVVHRGGKLYGYNTDQLGFQTMLDRADISLKGKKVVILGSGGSSHMVQWVAKKAGASCVAVISRTGEDNYSNISRRRDGEILINTTPVGMFPGQSQSPCSLSDFPACQGVVDLIYNPLKTKLLMEAEKRQIPHVGGLSMLVAQAIASAELFFDKKTEEKALDEIIGALSRQMTNLVLIGMPGSGKSTIGRRLAKLSGRPLLETDGLIEEKAGMTIPEIFAQKGEDAFRRMETEVVRECGARQGVILVTGGGVVTRTENYEPLHQNGLIIEIVRSVDKLARKGRPLSANMDALYQMARMRRPLYEAFRDRRIQNYGAKQQVAEKIWRDFLENIGTERPKHESSGSSSTGNLRKNKV